MGFRNASETSVLTRVADVDVSNTLITRRNAEGLQDSPALDRLDISLLAPVVPVRQTPRFRASLASLLHGSFGVPRTGVMPLSFGQSGEEPGEGLQQSELFGETNLFSKSLGFLFVGGHPPST